MFLIKVSAQETTYIFPIKTGKSPQIIGTLGEIRHNHFHGGIDVRTNYTTGLKIFAIEDGYIERLAYSSYGFGKAVYIKHNDGNISVYAHLKRFSAEIDSVLKAYLYKHSVNDADFYLPKNQIRVKKGDVIGYSGNSGHSSGPHLHFELRDKNEILLDPLDYYDLPDDFKPSILRLAVVPLTMTATVNGNWIRKDYKIRKVKSGKYIVTDTVRAEGEIGIEIRAFDRLNATFARNGFKCIELIVDGDLIFKSTNEGLDYNQKLSMNRQINYPYYWKTGVNYQRLYHINGNRLNNTTNTPKAGFITTNSKKTIEFQINVNDAKGNLSSLCGVIKSEKPKNNGIKRGIRFQDHFIKYVSEKNTLELFRNNYWQVISPTDSNSGTYYYPIDLYNSSIPDSIRWDSVTRSLELLPAIAIPNTDMIINKGNIRLILNKNSLFDTSAFRFSQASLDELSIKNGWQALKGKIDIEWQIPTPNKINTTNTSVYRKLSSGRLQFISSSWEGNKVKFNTSYVGTFRLQEDDDPPVGYFKIANRNHLVIKTYDQISGIDRWGGRLNNKWVHLVYNHKRGELTLVLNDKTKRINGDFEVDIWDKQGNKIRLQRYIP